jgi:hypothetical protein
MYKHRDGAKHAAAASMLQEGHLHGHEAIDHGLIAKTRGIVFAPRNSERRLYHLERQWKIDSRNHRSTRGYIL